jgi:hypothetical protein
MRIRNEQLSLDVDKNRELAVSTMSLNSKMSYWHSSKPI